LHKLIHNLFSNLKVNDLGLMDERVLQEGKVLSLEKLDEVVDELFVSTIMTTSVDNKVAILELRAFHLFLLLCVLLSQRIFDVASFFLLINGLQLL
jgi:hypothetical protein